MTSSLQQGITAAKAGRMGEALDFLKDAIIEEPQNAEVWVWVAAIIDDLEKQEIFLDKALEIDPNNIPAQRGMAYLQKRKQDEASVQNDHLSDHTSPISPFPASKRQAQDQARKTSTPEKLPVEDLEHLATAPERGATDELPTGGFFQNLPKISFFELSLLGVITVVFCFIGLLAASALFEFSLPLDFLAGSRPRLATEPPYPGVFLYENRVFFDIQQHDGVPTQDEGIPTSFADQPVIVLWQTEAEPEQMDLIYETGSYIPIQSYAGKSEADLLQPERDLQPGLYCLRLTAETLTLDENPYWCFKVVQLDPEN